MKVLLTFLCISLFSAPLLSQNKQMTSAEKGAVRECVGKSFPLPVRIDKRVIGQRTRIRIDLVRDKDTNGGIHAGTKLPSATRACVQRVVESVGAPSFTFVVLPLTPLEKRQRFKAVKQLAKRIGHCSPKRKRINLTFSVNDKGQLILDKSSALDGTEFNCINDVLGKMTLKTFKNETVRVPLYLGPNA